VSSMSNGLAVSLNDFQLLGVVLLSGAFMASFPGGLLPPTSPLVACDGHLLVLVSLPLCCTQRHGVSLVRFVACKCAGVSPQHVVSVDAVEKSDILLFGLLYRALFSGAYLGPLFRDRAAMAMSSVLDTELHRKRSS
jgi:hypothetical protein